MTIWLWIMATAALVVLVLILYRLTGLLSEVARTNFWLDAIHNKLYADSNAAWERRQR